MITGKSLINGEWIGAINRFLRPVSYQNLPQELLPDGIKDDADRGVRLITS